MAHTLPPEVEHELGSLLSELNRAGFVPEGSLYSPEAFGNRYVDFAGPAERFRIIKDRSVYVIDGPTKEEREHAGLWRGFDSLGEFRTTLMNWLRSKSRSV